MPNWVRNKVYFENKQVLKDCLSIENERKIFDFNKVIPRPISLNLSAGGKECISVVYAISKMDEKTKKQTIDTLKNKSGGFYKNYYEKLFKNNDYTKEDFEKANQELISVISGEKENFEEIDYKVLGIKNLEDLGNTYINNILNYGYDTWYDWSCENWGTKWNASDTYYVDENSVEFDTAWSTPYNIFKTISKIYNTRVEVNFADENIGYNCGTIIFENGEEISFVEEDTWFAEQIWGYCEQ